MKYKYVPFWIQHKVPCRQHRMELPYKEWHQSRGRNPLGHLGSMSPELPDLHCQRVLPATSALRPHMGSALQSPKMYSRTMQWIGPTRNAEP